MNLKVVLMLCLILFAFASTMTTMIAFSGQTADVSTESETVPSTLGFHVEPTGDEVDDPVLCC